MKPKTCIVIFDDDQGLSVPYGMDPDCDGALTPWTSEIPVEVFPDRKTAQRAITISKRLALLEKAQGKPHNSDFLECLGAIRIAPCSGATNAPALGAPATNNSTKEKDRE